MERQSLDFRKTWGRCMYQRQKILRSCPVYQDGPMKWNVVAIMQLISASPKRTASNSISVSSSSGYHNDHKQPHSLFVPRSQIKMEMCAICLDLDADQFNVGAINYSHDPLSGELRKTAKRQITISRAQLRDRGRGCRTCNIILETNEIATRGSSGLPYRNSPKLKVQELGKGEPLQVVSATTSGVPYEMTRTELYTLAGFVRSLHYSDSLI